MGIKKNQTKRIAAINLADCMNKKSRVKTVSPSEVTIKLGRYTLKTTPIFDMASIQSVEGVSIQSELKVIKPNKEFVAVGRVLQNTCSKTLSRLGSDIMDIVE